MSTDQTTVTEDGVAVPEDDNASSQTETEPLVVNIDEVDEVSHTVGEHWGSFYKVLTPSMPAHGTRLGVNLTRVPGGRTTCPFHSHQVEDEVFYVLSGRGVLRYGEAMRELRAGDCVSCPAGSGIAHQIANPFPEDFVYLAIGVNDADEICVYPDSDKVYIRSLSRIGWIEQAKIYDGEAAESAAGDESWTPRGDGGEGTPRIFGMFESMRTSAQEAKSGK